MNRSAISARFLLVLLLAAMLPTAAVAANLSLDAPFGSSPASLDRAPVALEPGLLFVELDRPDVHQPIVLAVEYRVDGTTFFAESLTAVAPERTAGTLAVELLGWHPDVRDALTRLAAEGAEVRIAISRQGGEGVSLTLTQLTAASDSLRIAGFTPATARSRVTSPAPADEVRSPIDPAPALQAKAKDPACIAQCFDERDQCEDNCYYHGGGAEDCFERCDVYFNQCYDGCPDICEGPTVREYDDTVVAGFNYWGPSYCFTWGPYAYVFHYGQIVYEHITYRETTYCDGSQTTEVVSSYYSYLSCWLRSGDTCYPPVDNGFYYPTCPA